MTESVRLTDEVQLKEQTDEEGDVFQWLKHQAGKGVLSAQVNLSCYKTRFMVFRH